MPVKTKSKPYQQIDEDVLTLVEEDYQLKIGENPDTIDLDEIEEEKLDKNVYKHKKNR